MYRIELTKIFSFSVSVFSDSTFLFVAETNHEGIHLRSLNETELEFVVSVGYFYKQEYRHIYFANMVSLVNAYSYSSFLDYK